jgi:hypothetical protein
MSVSKPIHSFNGARRECPYGSRDHPRNPHIYHREPGNDL